MTITIRPLDVSSDADVAQFNALDEAIDLALYGASEPFTLAQARARLEPTPYWRVRRWVALAEPMEGAQAIVARAATFEPLEENLDAITVGVTVHPAYRGQGIASQMLEEALIPAIRESGRTLVDASGEIMPGQEADDPALPANRLAARLGIARKHLGVCRTLRLPLDPELLERLDAQARERIGAYRVEVWDGPVPEEHLPAYGVLLAQLDRDDPTEELDYEVPEYTPERIRLAEERLAGSGMRAVQAVAIAPDGTMVGNSVIEWKVPGEAGVPRVGWQENTLVMPEHRGHRLGLALKVAAHRALAREAPELRVLATWNSHVNPWMIAINEQLGYRIAFHEVMYQGRVEL